MEAHLMQKSGLKALCGILIALNIADVITTIIGVRYCGLIESNRFFDPHLSDLPQMIGLKVVLLLPIWLIIIWAAKGGKPMLLTYILAGILTFANILYLMVVIHNVKTLV
jgi:hypothetical protein